MRESTVETALREGVESLGGRCYKFTSPGRAGVPDRIIVLPSHQGGRRPRIIFVETKAPGKKLRPGRQAREYLWLTGVCAEVYVIDTLALVRAFLQGLKQWQEEPAGNTFRASTSRS